MSSAARSLRPSTTLEEATRWLQAEHGNDADAAAAGATPYLRMFATTLGGFLLARSALAARRLEARLAERQARRRPVLRRPAAAAGRGAAARGHRRLGAARRGADLAMEEIVSRHEAVVVVDAGEGLLVADEILDREERGVGRPRRYRFWPDDHTLHLRPAEAVQLGDVRALGIVDGVRRVPIAVLEQIAIVARRRPRAGRCRSRPRARRPRRRLPDDRCRRRRSASPHRWSRPDGRRRRHPPDWGCSDRR